MKGENDEPLPSFVLPPAFPFMRSHTLSVLSLPRLSASLPVGWTATELTRPTWPLNERRTVQSRERKSVIVLSSEAVMRCVREGNCKLVMEPVDMQQRKSAMGAGFQQETVARTSVLLQPSDLLPPLQIPNFDNLVPSTRSEPLSTLGSSDSLDAGLVSGEDEDWLDRVVGLLSWLGEDTLETV